MHEVEEKTKKICELKDHILKTCASYVCCDEPIANVAVTGEFVDMVKDLCEAEEKLWKACYYETVVKSMKEAEENPRRYDDMDSWGPMGYNNRRYSSGRYAPAGRGHISGYAPYMMMADPELEEMMWDGRMGYSGENGSRRYGNGNGSNDYNDRSGYPMSMNGRAYDEYEDARRHYTESHNSEDKEWMNEKAMEHVDNAMKTFKKIWKDADPALKKSMKAQIQNMSNEMVV